MAKMPPEMEALFFYDEVTAENARLREALKHYADERNWTLADDHYSSDLDCWIPEGDLPERGPELAQRALEGK